MARTPFLIARAIQRAAIRRRSAVAKRSASYGGHSDVAEGHAFLRTALPDAAKRREAGFPAHFAPVASAGRAAATR
jgi:hypothetical protein